MYNRVSIILYLNASQNTPQLGSIQLKMETNCIQRQLIFRRTGNTWSSGAWHLHEQLRQQPPAVLHFERSSKWRRLWIASNPRWHSQCLSNCKQPTSKIDNNGSKIPRCKTSYHCVLLFPVVASSLLSYGHKSERVYLLGGGAVNLYSGAPD